jgi:small neutral amino acid transporter SnatA (MarC family)
MSLLKTAAVRGPSSHVARVALAPLYLLLMIVWGILLVAGTIMQALGFAALLLAQRIPGGSAPHSIGS